MLPLFSKSLWVMFPKDYQSGTAYQLQTRALGSYRRCYVSVLTRPQDCEWEEEHVIHKPGRNTWLLASHCTWVKPIQCSEFNGERRYLERKLSGGKMRGEKIMKEWDKKSSVRHQTKKKIPIEISFIGQKTLNHIVWTRGRSIWWYWWELNSKQNT